LRRKTERCRRSTSLRWTFTIFLLLLGSILCLVWLVSQRLFPFHFREVISEEAERTGLDPFLVAALIKVESGFDPEVVSPRGAIGLMQLMPQTAQWVAEQTGRSLPSGALYEPEVNIAVGTWYLADIRRSLDPRLPVVLAAYNGGRTRVGSWLRQGVWDGSEENLDDIPLTETRDFVRRTLASYRVYRLLYGLK